MVCLEHYDSWLWNSRLGDKSKGKKTKEKLKSSSGNKILSLETKFKTLHSLSVKLNALVLFSGLWLLGLTVSNFYI